LKEGAASVVSITDDAVQPANEGELIHFTGNPSGQILTDPLFQVSTTAIHLKRVAEMYQWQETAQTNSHQDVVGGGQSNRTIYTYKTIWSEPLIDSSSFHMTTEHMNPPSKRLGGEKWTASPVKVGAFTLSPALVDRIDNYSSLPLHDASREQLAPDLRNDSIISDGICYLSRKAGTPIDPNNPQVGDIRLSLQAVLPGLVSVIARQTGDSVSAYPTRAGGQIELLYLGAHPAAEMFATEQRHNKMLSWGLRLAGFVFMWFGLLAIVQPISVLASVVGILGQVVGTGLGMLCFLIAVALSTVIIALAWLAYRPLLGIGLLIVAAVAIAYLVARWRRRPTPARPASMAVSP